MDQQILGIFHTTPHYHIMHHVCKQVIFFFLFSYQAYSLTMSVTFCCFSPVVWSCAGSSTYHILLFPSDIKGFFWHLYPRLLQHWSKHLMMMFTLYIVHESSLHDLWHLLMLCCSTHTIYHSTDTDTDTHTLIHIIMINCSTHILCWSQKKDTTVAVEP